MTLTTNEINLICNLESSQILAIKQLTPDIEFTTRTLARIFAKQYSQIPLYVFSQALGLQEIIRQKRGEQIINSEALPKPELGRDPILHYLESYYNCDLDGIFIFLDLHKYLEPLNCDRLILSHLRTIGTRIKQGDNFKRLILLGQEISLPAELIRLIPVLHLPLPPKDTRIKALDQKLKSVVTNPEINLDNLDEATSGLTIREIFNQFNHYYNECILNGKEICENSLNNHFVQYKTKLLKSLKIEAVPPSNQKFGGHGALRKWLEGIKEIIEPEAREYGIPFPKGCLLGGVSGVGKTLIAEAISSSWNLPLIKISIPALKGGLVGESEGNLLRAIQAIKFTKGVLLIDEVEKCVAGAGTDSSGVTGSMLSILLDYMNYQEQHFIICTANNVQAIPAELMRKGRLDEVWFAGLPTQEERKEILAIHFFQKNRVKHSFIEEVKDFIPSLANETEYFSGAELAGLVTQGLTNIYVEKRAGEPKSSDFISLARSIIPLAKAQARQYQQVMEWSTKARSTSNYESNNQTRGVAISRSSK